MKIKINFRRGTCLLFFRNYNYLQIALNTRRVYN